MKKRGYHSPLVCKKNVRFNGTSTTSHDHADGETIFLDAVQRPDRRVVFTNPSRRFKGMYPGSRNTTTRKRMGNNNTTLFWNISASSFLGKFFAWSFGLLNIPCEEKKTHCFVGKWLDIPALHVKFDVHCFTAPSCSLSLGGQKTWFRSLQIMSLVFQSYLLR